MLQPSLNLYIDRKYDENIVLHEFFNVPSALNNQSFGITPDQPHCFVSNTSRQLFTRRKGLSLSLKNNHNKQRQKSLCPPIKNQKIVESCDTIKAKDFLDSLKTTHSIQNLGKSLGKSHQIAKKAIQKQQNSNFFINLNAQSYHLINNSSQQSFFTPQKIRTYRQSNSPPYKIQITTANKNPKYSQSKQSSLQKIGKIQKLKQRTFLRNRDKNDQMTIKQNDSKLMNLKLNCIQTNRQKLKNKSSLLKSTNYKEHIQVQVKSKRQFLESFIQKPTINSIILSRAIQDSQPDSPVLKLKKRLQLNSINCIYQKQTIISQQILQPLKSSSIIIQQSIIVDRNILCNFKPLMHQMNIFVQGVDSPYKIYLAQQIYSNTVVTIKEESVSNFQNFTRQLLIYTQINVCNFDKKNILQLYKFSTDTHSHILIKEPFTETLSEYMQNLVMKKVSEEEFQQACHKIIGIIKRNLQEFISRKIVLWRKFTLNDFVFVFSNLKIQNFSMFQLKHKQKICLTEALDEFSEQMQSFYCRISQRTLNSNQ